VSKRNEAKIDTLECVLDLGDVTSNDLSHIREVSLHCASMRLKRAHRQGLLTRDKIGKEYYYEINSKGIQRLAWLKKVKREKEASIYSALEIQFFPPSKSGRESVLKILDNIFQRTEKCKVKKDYNDESQNQASDNISDIKMEDVFQNVEKCEVRRERKTQQEEDMEKLFKRISQERCARATQQEEDMEKLFKRISQERCEVVEESD
jgi:hypothetical protein